MEKMTMLVGIVVAVAALGLLFVILHKTGVLQAIRDRNKQTTFAMIKPDAVAAKNSGKIIDAIEANGFNIVGMEKITMNKETAEKFYSVHKERPFFGELVEFVTSGPVIVLALEKDNAIKAWRDLMGATNPKDSAEGTLRKQFGTSIGNNALHGSDAPETAKTELELFFPKL